MGKITKISTRYETHHNDINFMQTFLYGTECETFKQEINTLFHPFWDKTEKYNNMDLLKRIETFIQEIADKLIQNNAFIKKEQDIKDFSNYVYNQFYGNRKLNEHEIRNFNIVASRENIKMIKKKQSRNIQQILQKRKNKYKYKL